MYSKYEEMCTMKQVIMNYTDNQKRNYSATADMIKEEAKDLPLDINSSKSNTSVESLGYMISSLKDYQREYQIGLSIIAEFNKATMCYEQGYTKENIESGLADERAKTGNRIYHEIRTGNSEYKRIIDEIAYDLFVSHDPQLDGLGLDFFAKEESLEKDFEAGRITKDQLIYYTNMCWSLSQNPQYISYMSQNQETEGINR